MMCSRGEPAFVAEATYADARAKFEQGDLAGARARAESAVRRLEGRVPRELWRFLLLDAEAAIWQGRNRDALSLIASEPRVMDPDIGARQATLRALAWAFLREFDRAEASLVKAQQLAPGASPDVAIEVVMADGWIADARGDPVRARRAFDRVVVLAHDQHRPFLEANARGSLGRLEMRRYHFAEAADWFQSSLAIARRIQARASIAKSLGNLGWSYMSLGELDRALDLFTEARAESERLGLVKDTEVWLTNLGALQSSRRDFEAAEASYRRALDIARQLEHESQVAFLLTNLAAVRIERGDLVRAAQYNDESLAVKRRLRDRASELYSIVNSGRVAARQGRRADAERAFEDVIREAGANLSLRADAQAGLGRLYAAAGEAAPADLRFREALRTLDQARTNLDRDEFKLSTFTTARAIYDDYIDFLIARGHAAAACGVAEMGRAQTLLEGLGLRRSDDGARPCPRPAGGVVLAYWLSARRGYLWIRTATESTTVTLPREHDIAALVARYRGTLSGQQPNGSTYSGMELYERLVRPAEH